MSIKNRTIFEGDNLDVLRGMNSESIDLIYLDPPFNSNKTYSAPIGSEAAGAAFKDSWTLDDVDNAWHGQIAEDYPELYQCIIAAALTQGKPMKAYLIMMSIRLIEMKRVLKPTGSIYLHCDPTASHYLKMVMDSIFGKDNFRNEIVWHYGKWTNAANYFQRNHDIILFYANSNSTLFNKQFMITDDKRKNLEKGYHTNVIKGVRQLIVYNRKKAAFKIQEGNYDKVVYRDDKNPGVMMHDTWNDINILNSQAKERTGYPTQKPLALLDRIIKASSNKGEIVLDPFCGCATTCLAAENLKRKWIGIDLSYKAVELVKSRIEKEMPLLKHLVGKISHRTDVPERTDTPRTKQVTLSSLFSKIWIQEEKKRIRKSDVVLSQADLRAFVSVKHTLYGLQEGKCNGCQILLPIRNLTIDHIIPRIADGTDDIDNLQLLCGACNSTKGTGTQQQLIAKLKDQDVLRG